MYDHTKDTTLAKSIQVYGRASGSHGHVRQCDMWEAYCMRLQQYFLANSNEGGEKQRAVLWNACVNTVASL